MNRFFAVLQYLLLFKKCPIYLISTLEYDFVTTIGMSHESRGQRGYIIESFRTNKPVTAGFDINFSNYDAIILDIESS
jgi:hypothetical protein